MLISKIILFTINSNILYEYNKQKMLVQLNVLASISYT